MKLKIALLVLLGLLGGLAIISFRVGQAPTNTAVHFEADQLLAVEDHEDYPDDPRALHPTYVHLINSSGKSTGEIQASFETPGLSRNNPIRHTSRAIYYFNGERAELVSAVDQVSVPGTQVQEERFGGFFAVQAVGDTDVLAYGRTHPQDNEFVLELVVITRDGDSFSESVVWRETTGSAKAVIPFAWADDHETIFFSTRPLSSGQPRYTRLLQVRVPQVVDQTDRLEVPDVSAVVFLTDTAELVALSADTNMALFIDQDGQDETAQTLTLQDLLSGREQTLVLNANQQIRAAAVGVEVALIEIIDRTETSGQSSFWVMQFALDRPLRLSVPGEQHAIVKINGGEALVTSQSGRRGTWRLPLAGRDDAELVSEWLVQ
ncbi:MAG: hypothetical protein Q8P33_02655 [bacterium]|nr:hypothetical protein [bacterium]